MSFIGKSPKLDRVRFTPLNADPTNPSEGDEFYSDGTVRAEGKWVYKNGAFVQVGSSQESSSIITGDDSSIEGSIGAWVAYADASAAIPENGTGGSPTLTVTRTTSASLLLNGTASLLLTKDAADRRGEGASLDVAVPNYLKGQPAKLKFSSLASTNFSFGTFMDPSALSDVVMYLYDVTNSKLLSPNVVHLSGSGYEETQIQIPSDCASIRVILHVATTNENAYTLSIDDVQLGIDPVQHVSANSDSVLDGTLTISATTTPPSKGTIVEDEVYYQQVGNLAHIWGVYSQSAAGSAGSGDYLFKMPAGLKIDTSVKVPYATSEGQGGTYQLRSVLGTVQGFATSEGNFIGSAVVYDEDYFRFMGSYSIHNANRTLTCIGSGAGGLALSQATITYTFDLWVPVLGWTSGFKTPSTIGQNVPAVMRAYKSGGSMTATTTIGSWTAKSKDTTNSFNISTGIYTVKSPGDYQINFNVDTTANTASTGIKPYVLVNGTEYAHGISSDGVLGDGLLSTVVPDLKVGDVLTFEITATRTAQTNDYGTVLSIYKIETPTASLNIPKITYLKDVKTSGTDGGTFTSGSYQTRTLNTQEGDTGFCSLSSNQFTLQPGTYEINAAVPAYRVLLNKAKLYNTTSASDTILGSSANSFTSNEGITHSFIYGQFTITATTVFEIQHKCNTTLATTGFGIASSFVGDSEVYTVVKIQKIY